MLTKLREEFWEFCHDVGFPQESADDILIAGEQGFIGLKSWQRSYLLDYLHRWNQAELRANQGSTHLLKYQSE